MRRHDTPQTKPQRLPFVRLAFGDLEGERWTFRLCSPGTAQRLASQWTHAKSEDDLYALESACGAILGACWADEQWALECDPEVGREVYDELWDAAWDFGTIVAAASALMERMAEIHLTEKEVKERVRFFDAAGGTTSPPSTTA